MADEVHTCDLTVLGIVTWGKIAFRDKMVVIKEFLANLTGLLKISWLIQTRFFFLNLFHHVEKIGQIQNKRQLCRAKFGRSSKRQPKNIQKGRPKLKICLKKKIKQ